MGEAGQDAKQNSPEEIRRYRLQCWNPNCKRRAWFEDWAGWQWCPYHMYWTWRWGGGNRWQELKWIKLYFGR